MNQQKLLDLARETQNRTLAVGIVKGITRLLKMPRTTVEEFLNSLKILGSDSTLSAVNIITICQQVRSSDPFYLELAKALRDELGQDLVNGLTTFAQSTNNVVRYEALATFDILDLAAGEESEALKGAVVLSFLMFLLSLEGSAEMDENGHQEP